MAKIIGYNPHIKKQYKATCQKCGAIIIFDEDEVKDNYQYNEYCFSFAPCPNCKENVSFDKNKSRISKIKKQ